MVEKRRVSKRLVNALICEQRDYDAAAKVVLISQNAFDTSCSQIADLIYFVEELPTELSALELECAIEGASDEIADHSQWQEQVMESVPEHDYELSAPLREAFNRCETARNQLHLTLARAHTLYRAAS